MSVRCIIFTVFITNICHEPCYRHSDEGYDPIPGQDPVQLRLCIKGLCPFSNPSTFAAGGEEFGWLESSEPSSFQRGYCCVEAATEDDVREARFGGHGGGRCDALDFSASRAFVAIKTPSSSLQISILLLFGKSERQFLVSVSNQSEHATFLVCEMYICLESLILAIHSLRKVDFVVHSC